MAVSVAAAQGAVASEHSTRTSDRVFYSSGAWFCAGTVLAGFSPTFFLAPLLDRPMPRPLLIVHGVLLTVWFTLYIAQTALVARGRTSTHRRLGRFGAVFAIPLVAVLGAVLIDALERDATRLTVEALTQQLLSSALVFVAVAALISLAIAQRRNPMAHKRLMWSSAILLQVAGLGRLVALLGIPWATLPVMIVLALSNAVYDLATMRRVHWASVLGGVLALTPVLVFLVGGGVGRIPLAQDLTAWLFL